MTGVNGELPPVLLLLGVHKGPVDQQASGFTGALVQDVLDDVGVVVLQSLDPVQHVARLDARLVLRAEVPRRLHDLLHFVLVRWFFVQRLHVVGESWERAGLSVDSRRWCAVPGGSDANFENFVSHKEKWLQWAQRPNLEQSRMSAWSARSIKQSTCVTEQQPNNKHTEFAVVCRDAHGDHFQVYLAGFHCLVYPSVSTHYASDSKLTNIHLPAAECEMHLYFSNKEIHLLQSKFETD